MPFWEQKRKRIILSYIFKKDKSDKTLTVALSLFSKDATQFLFRR